MRPTTKTDVKFEHIGAARLYNGSVRIDVKTMQAVIPAGEVHRLEDHWPAATVFRFSASTPGAADLPMPVHRPQQLPKATDECNQQNDSYSNNEGAYLRESKNEPNKGKQ